MARTVRERRLVESHENGDGPDSVAVGVVDCDVHPHAPLDVYRQFLPERWRDAVAYSTNPVRNAPNQGMRYDAQPQDGRYPGSDPVLMDEQLLYGAGVDYAILVPHHSGGLPHPDADAAWQAALNTWQAETWLSEYNGHARYRGSIRVPMHNPDAAIREIERWADHPYFVQLLAVHSYSPAYGHPMYEPIWRAAAERGLPVAIHAGNTGLGTAQHVMPVGHPTYFFEWHATIYSMAYVAHLSSLVCNGVFERYPDLRFVMIEGGFSWSLALGNHLDKNWRRLRAEVPELTLAPSEYLKRNVLFSSQPIEEPRDPAALLHAFELLDAEHRLMFATDYPHWDFDDPVQALPRLPEPLRRRIMFETACELYGLPTRRPAG